MNETNCIGTVPSAYINLIYFFQLISFYRNVEKRRLRKLAQLEEKTARTLEAKKLTKQQKHARYNAKRRVTRSEDIKVGHLRRMIIKLNSHLRMFRSHQIMFQTNQLQMNLRPSVIGTVRKSAT